MKRSRALRAIGGLVFASSAIIGCDDGVGPVSPTLFTAVATGALHTCGIDEGGTVYCWGNGTAGELGNGVYAPSVIPRAAPVNVSFVSLSAGARHTCAITTENEVFCWGWNFNGQLGNASTIDQGVPVTIDTPARFVQVSSGWFHTCGVTRSRGLVCWGANGQGQLGDGTTIDRDTPRRIANELEFASVSAGGFHTCAVTTDGQAYCWGLNNQGQLGTGTLTSTLRPARVETTLRFTSMAAGYSHSCGLVVGGIPYCWGSNADGEMGVAFTSQPGFVGSNRPAAVHDVTVPYTSLDAGLAITCGVLTQGPARCWGRGTDGQLGNGAYRSWPAPQPIPSVPDFAALSARGETHSCGVTTSRVILCWGRGDYGQLGPATPASSLPVRLPGVG
jgi:alpha-tubulin suppressor-like RCC1 family protein